MGYVEGRSPLGIPIRRWQFNIKMDLDGIGKGGGRGLELD